MAEIELETGVVEGLEKRASYAFQLPAGTTIKVEIGIDELDIAVPTGKIWYGKFQLFIREDDAS